MDCPKCGAPNPDDSDKCAYCGNTKWDNLPGFNFGAFTLTWLWAFEHGLVGWGFIMLFLYPFNFLVLVRVIASDNESRLIPLFFLLMIIKWFLSIHLGYKGNRIAYKAMPNKDVRRFEKSQERWSVVGVVYVLLYIAAFVIIPPPIYRSRSRANFTACIQQLKNIGSGMEQEISVNGSLKNVRSVEDVCHHILSGYDKPAECRGEVKKRIEEICVPGSLKFKKIGEEAYEIKAISNERLKCNICVTENAASPPKYGPEECAAATCVH